MTLGDIVFVLFLIVGISQFWRIRAISEAAKSYLIHYCDKENLQLISVARQTTKLGIVRGKPDWRTEFAFEFSGNGEDRYQGTITMEGIKVKSTVLPPFKVY